jgi:predicted ester cyclase
VYIFFEYVKIQEGGNMTSLGENKAIVQQAWEIVFNQSHINLVGKYFDDNYLEYKMDGSVTTSGLEQLKKVSEWIRRVFPDFHCTIEELLAEGDKVFSRVIVTATQCGEYHGVAATGRIVQFGIMMVSRIANGKIVEDWSLSDDLSLLKQIADVSFVAKLPE